MSVVAIVPAAGSGRRAGQEKLFRPVRGVPVIVRTLRRLSAVAAIHRIIVIARPRDHRRIRQLVRRYRLAKVRAIVAGGPTRMASVRRGLAALDNAARWCVIHDAARPLIAPALVRQVIRAARRCRAAIAALPAMDTIKRCRANGTATRLTTLPRHQVWLAQTPQVFERRLIQRAYEAAARAGVRVTDDAAAVERLGVRVALVPGTPTNVKITWPSDFAIAETLLTNGHRG